MSFNYSFVHFYLTTLFRVRCYEFHCLGFGCSFIIVIAALFLAFSHLGLSFLAFLLGNSVRCELLSFLE